MTNKYFTFYHKETQFKRGGLVLCFEHANVAASFRNLYNSCLDEQEKLKEYEAAKKKEEAKLHKEKNVYKICKKIKKQKKIQHTKQLKIQHMKKKETLQKCNNRFENGLLIRT